MTFDDGWIDQYNNVYPILRERGFVATFYIIANDTGEERMSGTQIKELFDGLMLLEHKELRSRLDVYNFPKWVWYMIGIDG